MTKMLSLVKNELSKLFRKKTVWILLILTAFISVSVSSCTAILNDEYLGYYFGTDAEDFAQYCDEEVALYTELLANLDPTDEYYEDNYESYSYHAQLYTYYKSLGLSWNDWRYDSGYAETIFQLKHDGAITDAEYQVYFNNLLNNKMEDYYRLEYYDSYNATVKTSMDKANVWLADLCIANGIAPTDNNSLYSVLMNTQTAYASLMELDAKKSAGFDINEETYNGYKEKVLIAEYRVKNNIDVLPSDSFNATNGLEYYNTSKTSVFWNIMAMTLSLLCTVAIFIIVIAGTIVSNEYSSGTVKFLILAPVKRWKILVSKYVTVLLVGLLMAFVTFFGSFIVGVIADGHGLTLHNLAIRGGVVVTTSPFWMLIKNYLLTSVSILVMSTLAFAISAISKGPSLAIGIGLGAYFVGSSATSIMQLLGFDVTRYFIFANLDFTAVVNGTTGYAHHTLTASILSVVIHMLIFGLIAWDGFNRREL